MKRTSTKDAVLDSALTLFSERGYDGVGMDLIASSVGIKGPSLYRHFSGKEDILNTLIDRMEEYYSQRFGSGSNPGALPRSLEELERVTLERIEFTLTDPRIVKVRKFIAMEQFRNPRIAGLATLHFMDGLVQMYRGIFTGMMDAGILKQDDPTQLALEFSAPVSLLIHACDRQPEKKAEFTERIKAHIAHFLKTYGA